MKKTFKNLASILAVAGFVFIAFGSQDEIYDITSEITYEIEKIDDLFDTSEKDVERAIEELKGDEDYYGTPPEEPVEEAYDEYDYDEYDYDEYDYDEYDYDEYDYDEYDYDEYDYDEYDYDEYDYDYEN